MLLLPAGLAILLSLLLLLLSPWLPTAPPARCPVLPQVRFAPGPWSEKFDTQDGHPDHEGQLARQRRSSGQGWGRDLTPSAVRAVEAELGEACRPSIDRLKRRWARVGVGGVLSRGQGMQMAVRRPGQPHQSPMLPPPLPPRRVGLLPLRKRPLEYYELVNGGQLGDAAAANGSVDPATAAAAGDGGGGERPGKRARGAAAAAKEQAGGEGAAGPQAAANGKAHKQLPPKLKQQAQGHAGKATALAAAAAAVAAAAAAAAATAAPPSVNGGAGAGILPALGPGAGLPPMAVTFGRKRGQGATTGEQQNGDPAAPAGGGKRATAQRLGSLSGPVGGGLLGTFSKRT